MDIKQIRLEKNKMDKMIYESIYKAIADFKGTTGLDVNSISIQFYELNNILGGKGYCLGEVNTTVEIF